MSLDTRQFYKTIVMRPNPVSCSDPVLRSVGEVLQFIVEALLSLSRQKVDEILNNPNFITRALFNQTERVITIEIGSFSRNVCYSSGWNTIHIDVYRFIVEKMDFFDSLVRKITLALGKRIKDRNEEYLEHYKEKLVAARGYLDCIVSAIEAEELCPCVLDTETIDLRTKEVVTRLLEEQCSRDNMYALENWVRDSRMVEDAPECLTSLKCFILPILAKKRKLYQKFIGQMKEVTEKIRDKDYRALMNMSLKASMQYRFHSPEELAKGLPTVIDSDLGRRFYCVDGDIKGMKETLEWIQAGGQFNELPDSIVQFSGLIEEVYDSWCMSGIFLEIFDARIQESIRIAELPFEERMSIIFGSGEV